MLQGELGELGNLEKQGEGSHFYQRNLILTIIVEEVLVEKEEKHGE
jgi:hypothetical protein